MRGVNKPPPCSSHEVVRPAEERGGGAGVIVIYVVVSIKAGQAFLPNVASMPRGHPEAGSESSK